MLLITMGFLIVVLIYINMQRECWNGKVCAKSTLTQNSKEPVCCSRPAQVFITDWLSRKTYYNKSVETQDGCHITTHLNVTGAVNPNHHEPLCRYQNGSLLFINTKQTPERRMLIHLLLRGFNVGFWPKNLDLSGFLCYNMYINYIWSLRDYIRWKSGGWSA